MIKNKEKNFVSAVVYCRDSRDTIGAFLGCINDTLKENFEK